MPSLRMLPKARDGLSRPVFDHRISFWYFEHCCIEQEGRAIACSSTKQ
ncbi:hypothetical protein [Leptolyngbya iicbica]|uniref:Uncharacterized protein n=1 Tax=Lyngbya confervoides BDU141951 TaxID=1574623 RepID=A0A8T6QTZ6_9CYAN